MSKSISEEIDEILRTKIEIQFPESLAPNPVVIYGEAFEALTALFNKHVEELLPKESPYWQSKVENTTKEQGMKWYERTVGYNQALDDIKAKLKE